MRFRKSELSAVNVSIFTNEPKRLECLLCGNKWAPETKDTTKGPVLFGQWYVCPACQGVRVPEPPDEEEEGTPVKAPMDVPVNAPMDVPEPPTDAPVEVPIDVIPPEKVPVKRGRRNIIPGYHDEIKRRIDAGTFKQTAFAHEIGVSPPAISGYMKRNFREYLMKV